MKRRIDASLRRFVCAHAPIARTEHRSAAFDSASPDASAMSNASWRNSIAIGPHTNFDVRASHRMLEWGRVRAKLESAEKRFLKAKYGVILYERTKQNAPG